MITKIIHKKLNTESLVFVLFFIIAYFLINISYEYIDKNGYITFQSLNKIEYLHDLLKTQVIIFMLFFIITTFFNYKSNLNIDLYIRYISYGFYAGFLIGYIVYKIIT